MKQTYPGKWNEIPGGDEFHTKQFFGINNTENTTYANEFVCVCVCVCESAEGQLKLWKLTNCKCSLLFNNFYKLYFYYELFHFKWMLTVRIKELYHNLYE